MKKPLFDVRKAKYKKVIHPCLPAKPESKPEFVLVGKKFKSKPTLLVSYLKGGWKFSQKRKEEIQFEIKEKERKARVKYRESINKLFEKIFGN